MIDRFDINRFAKTVLSPLRSWTRPCSRRAESSDTCIATRSFERPYVNRFVCWLQIFNWFLHNFRRSRTRPVPRTTIVQNFVSDRFAFYVFDVYHVRAYTCRAYNIRPFPIVSRAPIPSKSNYPSACVGRGRIRTKIPFDRVSVFAVRFTIGFPHTRWNIYIYTY